MPCVRPVERHGMAGVALVGILWLLALLTLIGSSLTTSSRLELQLTANLRQGAAARHAADAGVAWALWSLLQPGTDGWLADGSVRRLPLEGLDVQVALFDEQGKIDLNEAGPELLQGLLRAVGVAEDEARVLSDAILDWRDEDDERRPLGAEADEYALHGLSPPGNRPFARPQELRLVLGIDEALYARLAPALTVLSRKAEINPLLAPPLVLQALPGLTPETIEAFVEQRRRSHAEGSPPPELPGVPPELLTLTAAGFNYAVDIEVVASSRSISRQRVWLSRRGQGVAAGFQVLERMPER